MISISGVSKLFGSVRAVDNVTLDIARNEFFAILGPSGSGKTTLLRLLAGFEIPNAGEIYIDREPVSEILPNQRPTNMVFQNYAIFPHLDVRSNIAYGLRADKLGKAEANRRVDAALELVKLQGLDDRRSTELSGGQRQRVALARALIKRPKVLLLDEPLGALDKKLREEMQLELRALQQSLGITFIFVTHDQEEALTMADRIVVMDNGVIDQIGTPIEIYGTPATSFVADFVGVMNFIPGTVESDGAARIGKVTLNCSTNDMAPGTSVTVAIRPEDINAQDIATGDDNVVDAEIRRIEFLGSFCRAELGGAAFGDEIIHADFSINLIRRKNVQVGSTLLVRFPSQFIQLYPQS